MPTTRSAQATRSTRRTSAPRSRRSSPPPSPPHPARRIPLVPILFGVIGLFGVVAVVASRGASHDGVPAGVQQVRPVSVSGTALPVLGDGVDPAEGVVIPRPTGRTSPAIRSLSAETESPS